MDKWIALNGQTAGKDRIARFLQYLSRAIWDALEQKDLGPAFASQLKTLEYILSSFRKLLRFGKCFEVFYSSLKSIHYPDITIRVSLTLSKLASSLYLFADHMLWLSRTGLFRNIDTKMWTLVANKYWLLAIVMNLVRDVYEIMRLIDIKRTHPKKCPATPLASLRDLGKFAMSSYWSLQLHKNITVDTVKNICDLFIPLTALGYTKLSPGTIGILGAISSLAGLLSIIQPNARLSPV